MKEDVKAGDMLMLHRETGDIATGIFEYTLDTKENGLITVNSKLVMSVLTEQ